MKPLLRYTLSFLFLISFFFGVYRFGSQPIVRASQTQTFHKVVAPPGTLQANGRDIILLQDYGAYLLYLVSSFSQAGLSSAQQSQISQVDYMDTLLMDAYPFNTQTEAPQLPESLTLSNPDGAALHLVQFVGPIKPEWLAALENIGVTPIQYIAHNGYLLWADDNGRARLAQLVASNHFLQYNAPYQPYFKLGLSLRERIANDYDPAEILPVTIQIYNHPGVYQSKRVISQLAQGEKSPWSSLLTFQNTTVMLRAADIESIATLPDVIWLGEWFERELTDEVQGQILAGNLDGSQSGPAGPGYLAGLNGLGFSTDPADYPVVDIVDDGIGNGTVNSGDNTLHELGDFANPTRLAYVSNCTSSASGEGVDGHGHINISIAGGYDSRAGLPYQDPDGFQRGLGISPYGRFAGTRVFDASGFDLSSCGGTDTSLIKSSQDDGAQITSNSWGCDTCTGSYDTTAQAFDLGVRDADLTETGNQEMIIVFAAGNGGSAGSTVYSPGNGKNIITVGASESDRPSDVGGSWTDGCGIGPTGADNAMDIIFFSSRGPAPGGRVKPEVMAPGTHIQGTASTSAGYTGATVCQPYHPSGQTTFTASSGTSHATPAVAGVTSLYYYWLENRYGLTPSPAMMKAYLIAHPTYLTGVDANDTLPSNNQGYGMPNLSLAFNNTLRELEDQSVLLDNSGETWTWTGAVADPTEPVRIVLAYTDAPGAVGTSPQVNDLNLTADVDGTTYLGNVFSGQWSTTGGSADTANNYEAIFLPVGISGNITVTVTAFNIAGDGVPNVGDGTDQDFALVCYNCTNTPGFTLSSAPASQDVCAPSDALFTIDVGQLIGFAEAVTLSTNGLPAGLTSGFAPNGSLPPYASTLTVGNTGAVAAGNYTFDVIGTAVSATHTATLGLDIDNGSPGTPSLLSPADGATGVGFTPSIAWTAAAGASSYLLEIDDDPAFASPDYSTTTTSTSHTVGTSLASSTVYYWRVQALNSCGGATSAAFSFETQALTCTVYDSVDVPQQIAILSLSSLPVGSSGTILDVNVLNLAGTYPVMGVLDFYLYSPALTEVQLQGQICGAAADFDLNYDDEAAAATPPCPPTDGGTYQPFGALSDFDGEDQAGTWLLFIFDPTLSTNTGWLDSWSLEICTGGASGGTAVWDGEGSTFNWSEGANWVGDLIPQPSDTVIFNTTSTKDSLLDAAFAGTVANINISSGYTGTITMDRSFAVTNDYHQGDGTFVVADPATAVMTVGGVMSHTHGTLRQTQTVNGSSNVAFLEIDDGSGNIKYRGVELDTTTSGDNLGSVTVSVRAVDLVTEFCTSTGALSPPYAGRCYDISPAVTGTGMVRLYALTSEVPPAVLTPAVYHYDPGGGVWTLLNTNASNSTIGLYTFAQAEASGFSPFLMADASSEPTAVSLQSFSDGSQANLAPVVITLLIGLFTFAILVRSRMKRKRP